MTDTIELEKVIIAGEVIFMTHEEVEKMEEEFSKYMKLYPHTEKTKKMYDEA